MLDMFKSDAFGVVALTDAINLLKFIPGRINSMGLFGESSVATTNVALEFKNNTVRLIPPTPRGGPGVTIEKLKRTMRVLAVPHFEINDAVMAEEVQNIRPWGSESGLETVMNVVTERLGVHTQSADATQEYSRMGAIKGIITYSDGTTLNLFTEMGVTQEPEIAFDLTNVSPVDGALRRKCATAIRLISANMEGTPFSEVRSFCGDAFFDDLLANKEVRDTYKGWPEAQILREGYVEPNGQSYGAFEFGGIIWENYRGNIGGQAYVHTDKCHIYPVGAPGFFKTVFAPADYNETVNTLGKRRYAKQYAMPNDKGIHFDTQFNALEYVTRPKALLVGRRGA